MAISMTVPISADRQYAPVGLKLVITLGHFATIAAMLYPFRRKKIATWIVGGNAGDGAVVSPPGPRFSAGFYGPLADHCDGWLYCSLVVRGGHGHNWEISV
jgi:hypothetical protein